MKRKGRKSSSKQEKDVENGEDSSNNADSVENNDNTLNKNNKSKKVAANESDDDSDVEEKGKKRARTSRKADSDNSDWDDKNEEKSKSRKKSKKKTNSKSTENGDKDESEKEEDYEVEAVLDEKKIRGVKHYLIRWKGYESESDTWEPESTLNCPELIEEYKSKHDKSPSKEKSKSKKTDDKKSPKKRNKSDKKTEETTWDENEDFEVERIREVHFRRDGTREFLVHWKGYPSSEDTWEPEEHMDCKDLIEKFMQKVEKAKAVDTRELRTNRSHTNRFTLSMDMHGRRLSKRFQGKQRTTYHDAE